MTRTVKLNELDAYLSTFSYPLGVDEAADADATLRLADGETTIGRVLGDSTATRFDSAEELAHELLMLLPRRAVGEPFQSDGDA